MTMDNKPANSRLKQALLFLLFVLITTGTGYLIGKGMGEIAPGQNILNYFVEGKVSGLNLTLSILLSMFAILAIHESGHLIAGLAQGFRFCLFVVGPLGIKRTDDDKVTIYLNKDIQLYGGVASTEPTDNESDIAGKFGIVLLAGPATSLAFCFISIGLSYYTNSFFDLFLLISGLGHLAIFFGTTIPDKSGLFFTDRKRWQRLKNNGAAAKAELGILHAIGLESREKSLANAEVDQLKAILEDEDDYCQFVGRYFLWKHFKDKGCIASASDEMQKILPMREKVPSSVWRMMELPE